MSTSTQRLTSEELQECIDFHERSMDIVRNHETPDEHPPYHETVFPAIAAARIVAKHHGYALTWHGSMARDIDLVAVPWTERASPPELLAAHIVKRTGGWLKPSDNCPTQKPHGRLAWSIHLLGTGVYIDLSIMPLRPADQP